MSKQNLLDIEEAEKGSEGIDPSLGAELAQGNQALAANRDADDSDTVDDESIGSSAALISICTIISRITGFARTWSMAYALGATFLSSSYQIANNLPSMLYELVMGGMLTTAFLPVYLSIKKKSGKDVSERYASNLLTIVVLLLGALSALCMVFPGQIIFTQTFYSDQSNMGTATLLFQFFAIQIVFYGAASVVSGLLNANRDYIWGAIAPVCNNIIVIAAFIIYALAPLDEQTALYVIAIGSPLGVFVQLVIQLPGLKRNGIRIRPRLDIHDPGIRETIALGVPALFVTICGLVTVSVANAASYTFADNGPSVIAYSRLWFTFPYSFLAIPVATAMFTELSSMQAAENTGGVIDGIVNGSKQIFFLMMPFAMFLVVFATPLVTLYHIGAFTPESIMQIAAYLAVLAIALPFYGVNTYLQMVFSSIRKMKAFSVFTLIGSVAQVAVIMIAAGAFLAGQPSSINFIAGGTIAMYLLCDVFAFIYLKRLYGADNFPLKPINDSILHGLLLGLAGSVAGGAVFFLIELLAGPMGDSLIRALVYVCFSGIVAIIVAFAPAIRMNLPEATFVTAIWNKLARKLHRK